MKHTLKLVMAAALLSSGAASFAATSTVQVGNQLWITDPLGSGQTASLYLLPSTGSLYFSNGTGDSINGVPTASVGGLVGALNIGKVAMTSVDGSTVTETILPIGSKYKTDQRAKVQIDASVTSLTVDSTTGAITLVDVKGGALQTAAPLTGILEGGTLQINNLQVDLANRTVYADLLNNAGTPYEASSKHLALWTISSVSGPTSLPIQALLAAGNGNTKPLTDAGFTIDLSGQNYSLNLRATTFLSGLKVTEGGFNVIADALGLTEGSTGYDTLKAVNDKTEGWGSMKATIILSSVPEPSTYALTVLGLAGMAVVARRRRG